MSLSSMQLHVDLRPLRYLILSVAIGRPTNTPWVGEKYLTVDSSSPRSVLESAKDTSGCLYGSTSSPLCVSVPHPKLHKQGRIPLLPKRKEMSDVSRDLKTFGEIGRRGLCSREVCFVYLHSPLTSRTFSVQSLRKDQK